MAIEPGMVIDGKYEILSLIGKGGMSYVYMAVDIRLGKKWALKEVRKSAGDRNSEIVESRLTAEANLMKRLDHPALPRIVDIIDSGETICIVMDYVKGKSLDKVIKEYGPQPEEAAAEWGIQLADALRYLHRQKPPVIYRDMKPGNIMLTPEGNVKIIDFGIAREYKESGRADTMILGTRGYAPPEQHGGRQTDARSDIYALGMTLHHLLTGADPRSPDYEFLPIRKFDRTLSEGLESIINKCTALDPGDRYQSCDELKYDLNHIEEVTENCAGRLRRKRTVLFILAILASLSMTVGVGCRYMADVTAQRDYEAKLDVAESSSYETKVESYLSAIDLSGGDIRPYIKLLKAYQDNNRFGDDESSLFMEKYNANQTLFDTDSDEYLDLIYQMGLVYFYLYSGGDGSFRTRILKSYPWFQKITESGRTDLEYYEAAGSYCIIGEFYERYVVDAVSVKEPEAEDYRKLINSLEDCVEYVEDYGSDDEAYIKLTVYREAANLLNNYRMGMADAGVDEDEVLGLLDTVCRKAAALTVTQEKSVDIQDELEDDCEVYTSNIQRAYINTRERSEGK